MPVTVFTSGSRAALDDGVLLGTENLRSACFRQANLELHLTLQSFTQLVAFCLPVYSGFSNWFFFGLLAAARLIRLSVFGA